MITNYKSLPIGKRGFSLIELLVYISILVFLTVVIMDTLASTTRLSATQNSQGASTRSVITILNRLNREVKSADTVSIVSGDIVLDGETLDLSQFVETGVNFSNLSFSLTESTSSVKVHTIFTLDGEDYYSTSVLRHKQ